MIAKNQKTKDINTALLATYRKLNKAVNYNSTFYYNMAVMNDSISSMSNVIKSMWENAVSYANKINALRTLLYMKIYDLYSEAINAIKRWNEDIEKGPELQEAYNTKYQEWQTAVAEASALYAELQTMTAAYNTWFENTYVPQYNYANEQWVIAVTALNNTRSAKQAYEQTYNSSYFKSNWKNVNAFVDFIEGRDPTGTHWTLRQWLEYTVLSPGDGPYSPYSEYVYDNFGTEENPRWTYRIYKIQYGRSALDEDGLSAFYIHMYWYYQDDPTNEFDGMFYYGFDIEGTNPIHVPADDVDLLVSRGHEWMDGCASFQADLTKWNANHALYEQTVANYDTQIAAWDALADQWQDAMIDLNAQKSSLEQAVSDKSNEYKAKTKEATDLYIESLRLLWEYQNLSAKTMQDYIAAVKASIIYNDAVIKAHEEQEKQGKPLVNYPELPVPFNTFNSQTVPLPDDETPDMPDEPVEVPEDEEEDTRE